MADPFSRRLRKQRERSSLHARQLNKNALSMLHRQLQVLDRRQEQETRTLNRSRQALILELTDAEEPEHQAKPPRAGGLKSDGGRKNVNNNSSSSSSSSNNKDKDNRRHRQLHSSDNNHHHHHHHHDHVPSGSPRGTSLSLPMQEEKCAEGGEGRSSLAAAASEHRHCSPSVGLTPDISLPQLHSSSSSSFNSATDQTWAGSSLFSRHNAGSHDGHGTGRNSPQQLCRFHALSPVAPCPYFPCTRPHTYHRLGVSDCDVGLPDVVISLRGRGAETDRGQGTSPRGGGGQSKNVPGASEPTSESFPDVAGGVGGAGGGGGGQGLVPSGGSTSLSRKVESGHGSPRTSINDRLRGLRQLVQELRDKNDQKRPRDWAVNYGNPVSRRLLRKPVIPVAIDD